MLEGHEGVKDGEEEKQIGLEEDMEEGGRWERQSVEGRVAEMIETKSHIFAKSFMSQVKFYTQSDPWSSHYRPYMAHFQTGSRCCSY